jgi:hypothetical protein
MIIDFQHHYTPPQLLEGKKKEVSVGVDKNGNPMHLLNPLLGDIDAHVRMMDAAGIDAAVLSSMVGFDQPDLKTCRIINDDLKGVEEKHPGRFIGHAHVPALKTDEMKKELKRCKVELGFPGVVIASEMQGLGLDAPELKPFWKTCADLELYVFIHPLAKVINWNQMYADDLGRMLGWQFSLMTSHNRESAGHTDLYREHIDMPVFKSLLWDYEDLLMNDGCTGMAVLNPAIPQEVQFDEHKLLIVYGNPLGAYEEVFRRFGIPKDDKIKFLTEAEHVHSSTDKFAQQFEELQMRLGMDGGF